MILEKLHLQMRTKRSWRILCIYQLILIAITAGAYSKTYPWVYARSSIILGSSIFLRIVIAQLGVLMLIVPVLCAESLKIEYEQICMSGRLNSLPPAFKIWWGRFELSFLYLELLWMSSLPILSISFALGGVSGGGIVKAFVTTGIFISSFCSIGLLCSSLFRRSAHPIALTYAFVISLNVLAFIVAAILHNFAFPGIYSRALILLSPVYCLFSTMMPYGWLNVPIHDLFFGDDPVSIWNNWYIPLSFFILIGFISAHYAIRNIRRAIC
jgi:ABC-2 type transport system permease protein